MKLNAEEIKKLKRGEFYGTVATGLCGAVLVYFAVCFAISSVTENSALQLAVLISAPILLAAFAAAAAFFNLKYAKKLENIICDYVRDVFVENAALMHPEKQSLTFVCAVENDYAEVKVNAYKEKITFDFSAFGKLSATKKSTVGAAISNTLCVTFVRLLTERGASYSSVSYTYAIGKKRGKEIPVITGGTPDKRAYKTYLKLK